MEIWWSAENMSPSTIILVILMVSDTRSLLILDKLAQLKDKIVEKVLGDDNCGCPCREYSVIKCDVQWIEHCYQETANINRLFQVLLH